MRVVFWACVAATKRMGGERDRDRLLSESTSTRAGVRVRSESDAEWSLPMWVSAAFIDWPHAVLFVFTWAVASQASESVIVTGKHDENCAERACVCESCIDESCTCNATCVLGIAILATTMAQCYKWSFMSCWEPLTVPLEPIHDFNANSGVLLIARTWCILLLNSVLRVNGWVREWHCWVHQQSIHKWDVHNVVKVTILRHPMSLLCVVFLEAPDINMCEWLHTSAWRWATI